MSHMHAPIIGLKGFWYYAFFLSAWSNSCSILLLSHALIYISDNFKDTNQILFYFILAFTLNTIIFF